MREIDGWGMTGYKKGERGICAFTGWLLESAKALFENNQCAFTGWLLESAKAHAKLDQCAFTRWLLESAKAHFEIGPMRFYPMAAGERQSVFGGLFGAYWTIQRKWMPTVGMDWCNPKYIEV
jgi:hypothetical protein